MSHIWETNERTDLEGVRNLILNVSDFEGLSIYQMAKRAGLCHTTLWSILYRKNRRAGNSVHRSKLKRLGDGLGYQVRFDSKEGIVKFSKRHIHYPEGNVFEESVEENTAAQETSNRDQPLEQPMISEVDAIRALW